MDELLAIWELAESMGLPADASFEMSSPDFMSSLMAIDPMTEQYVYSPQEQALLMIELFQGKSFQDACAHLGLDTDFEPGPEPGSVEEAIQFKRIAERSYVDTDTLDTLEE